jgi:hypothetical protein
VKPLDVVPDRGTNTTPHVIYAGSRAEAESGQPRAASDNATSAPLDETEAAEALRRPHHLRISMLKGMKKFAFGAAAAAALFVNSGSAFSQSVEIGPGGVRVRGGECEQLRRACENKDVLGERGEGNCRRYRETNDQFGEMRAPNCDKPASTRTNWANEAKEIAAGLARLAEGACKER